MEQINIHPVYMLGKWLDSVILHARLPLKSNIFAWNYARDILDFLIAPGPGPQGLTLDAATQPAIDLSMAILNVLKLFQDNPETVLNEEQVTNLYQKIAAFEQAFALV